LKYAYKSKTPDELEALAELLLARFPSCLKNGRLDIESIVEAFPLRVVPRPGLYKLTILDAYLPHVGDVILIDADLSNDLPRYRLTLAEEISHRLLEPELWESGIPEGANIYELDAQMYDDIEGDAYRLARAILMPDKSFRERFNLLKSQLSVDDSVKEVKDLDCLTIEILAKEFEVPFNDCASRCAVLGICKGKIKKTEVPGAVIM
jgi:Zn-dependent peptidase ImmA (M78 family)